MSRVHSWFGSHGYKGVMTNNVLVLNHSVHGCVQFSLRLNVRNLLTCWLDMLTCLGSQNEVKSCVAVFVHCILADTVSVLLSKCIALSHTILSLGFSPVFWTARTCDVLVLYESINWSSCGAWRAPPVAFVSWQFQWSTFKQGVCERKVALFNKTEIAGEWLIEVIYEYFALFVQVFDFFLTQNTAKMVHFTMTVKPLDLGLF